MSVEVLTPHVEAHEQAISADFQFGEDREVQNIDTLVAELWADNAYGSATNIIIRGCAVAQSAAPGMSVQLALGSLFDAADEQFLIIPAAITGIAVAGAHATLARVDIVEVQRLIEDYDSQARATKNDAGSIGYSTINVKSRYRVAARTTAGTPGSGVAPNQSTGWVKIAEIAVGAAVTQILNANIKNVTATLVGDVNAAWTAETTKTYFHGSEKYNKLKFRYRHDEAGDHLAATIHASQTDPGVSAGQIDADIWPLGTGVASAPAGGVATDLQATSIIRAAIRELFDRLIDLSGAGNASLAARFVDWGLGGTQVKASDIPVADAGGFYDSATVEAALQETFADLAALTGAALVSVNDAADYYDNATVESVIAEIAQSRIGKVVAHPTKPETGVAGWLFCDGSVIDKSVNPQYTKLVDMLRTEVAGDPSHPYYDANANRAKLPDCRGNFVRFIDTGAGRDPAGRRKSGHISGPTTKTHTHSASESTGATHNHGGVSGATAMGSYNALIAIPTGGNRGSWTSNVYFHTHSYLAAGNHTHADFNNTAAGSSETRPRNTAMFYYVKY